MPSRNAPDPMTSYPLSTIAQAITDVPLALRDDPVIEILLTDSRALAFPDRSLFFALVTEKGDGHKYIPELYKKGVRAFVVSTLPDETYPGARFIETPDTLEALQRLGAWHRRHLQMPVVGITGSNGKTTLKEILYQLLHETLRVARSPKSYNSAIGVPLSLWGVGAETELALIEAGISKPGEMAVLEQMIAPTVGIITNIGEAHQEYFSSLDQKCDEKLKLFEHTEHIIYCADDPIISGGLLRAELLHKAIGWSRIDPSALVYVEELRKEADHTTAIVRCLGESRTYRIPYVDDGSVHDTITALTALSILRPEQLERPTLVEQLDPISMRLEVMAADNGGILINDTYNSDYDSLRIALSYLVRRNTEGLPVSVILSDIHESGVLPAALYRQVAQLLNQYAVEHVYLIGADISRFGAEFEAPSSGFRSTEDFLSSLNTSDFAGRLTLLKGARDFRFERIVHALQKQTHRTYLDVNLSHLKHNLSHYKERLPQGTQVVCMVKAFGYGTGANEISQALVEQGTDYLAVAVVDEGKALRDAGADIPIIVMNPEAATFAQMTHLRLQPEIYSMRLLRSFVRHTDTAGEALYPIHIKLDTGMHRLGFAPLEVEELISYLKGHDSVRVASVFTHLAAADDPREDAFTRRQLDLFVALSTRIEQALGYPLRRHALNTAGTLRFPEYALDMVRIGIGLYGLSPYAPADEGLLPVVALHTTILQIREVEAGETIGYGRCGRVDRRSRIGVVPIGYADGLPRSLGNGRITFRTESGVLVPTIGNVCMDTLMLDVTDDPTAREGSAVTLFDAELPIARIAEACDTIVYEVIARLSPRIARRYFSE